MGFLDTTGYHLLKRGEMGRGSLVFSTGGIWLYCVICSEDVWSLLPNIQKVLPKKTIFWVVSTAYFVSY